MKVKNIQARKKRKKRPLFDVLCFNRTKSVNESTSQKKCFFEWYLIDAESKRKKKKKKEEKMKWRVFH